MSEAAIKSSKFLGHQAPVLSLKVSQDDHLLLSGSEDHTARLWDLRDTNRRRASLCIQAGGDVLSVAFAPKRDEEASADLSSPFARDHSIYLSVEKYVYEYDLRKITSPIINQPTRDLSPILQNQDEVNQLALAYHHPKSQSSKGKRKGSNSKRITSEPKLYIAASDDAGTLRFMDSASSTCSQVLKHDINAVVTTCAFRPSNQNGSLEIASGGTDCKVLLWDAFKPKRPQSSFAVSTPETEAGKPQVCNPPMVYSLNWSPSGNLLAAGLGDGNVNIYAIENRNLVQTGLLPDGHDSSVASVLFPSFCKNKTERVLFSGGSDGTVLCWDLGANVCDNSMDAKHPQDLFASSLLQQERNRKSSNDFIQQTEELSLDKPQILFGIGNGGKINWMETSRSPSSLFVADTTNDITAYTIPLI